MNTKRTWPQHPFANFPLAMNPEVDGGKPEERSLRFYFIDSYFKHDVYIGYTTDHTNPSRGGLFVVYGPEEHQNYSSVDLFFECYPLTQMNECPTWLAAAAVAMVANGCDLRDGRLGNSRICRILGMDD